MMPGVSGFDVCARLKGDETTRDIPVISVTALSDVGNEAEGLALGAAEYVTKPINPSLARARMSNHFELKSHRGRLQEMVDERTHGPKRTQEAIPAAMGALAESRGPQTGGHTQRARDYVCALATKLSSNPAHTPLLDDRMIELLYLSAPLHDISSKVGIPDDVTLKRGKLTANEFERVKAHALVGLHVMMAAEKGLGHNSFLRLARETAETHDEKRGRNCYPNGPGSGDISIFGRLMAIGGVYGALIRKRVYKLPIPHSEAVMMIAEGKGTHFDSAMVETSLETQEEFRAIALRSADHDEATEALRR